MASSRFCRKKGMKMELPRKIIQKNVEMKFVVSIGHQLSFIILTLRYHSYAPVCFSKSSAAFQKVFRKTANLKNIILSGKPS